MNNFWKRKVPAFLLTLVMLASLAPAALAVSALCTDDKAHTWSEWATTEPTCKDPGVRVRICSKCQETEKETLNKTDIHNMKPVAGAGKPATCLTEGIETLKCDICGLTYTNKLPKTQHTPGTNGVCTVCHAQVNTPSTTTYTVTYRVGSGTPSSETVNKGGYPARVPSSPALTGVPGSHAFVGWVKGDLSYPGYRNQATTTPGATTVTGNVTYTAVYRLNATGRNDTLAVGTTAGKLVGTELRNKIAAMFGSLTGESSFSSVAFSTLPLMTN